MDDDMQGYDEYIEMLEAEIGEAHRGTQHRAVGSVERGRIMLDDKEFDTALRTIREQIGSWGNYGDAWPDEYARYAVNHGKNPKTVAEWAHLVTPMDDPRHSR